MPVAVGFESRTDEVIDTFVTSLADSSPDVDALVLYTCETRLEPSALALFHAGEKDGSLSLVGHRGSLSAEQFEGKASASDGALVRAVRDRTVSVGARTGREGATEVAVPFVFRNHILGAVDLVFDREVAISPDALSQLRTFGQIVGLALGEAQARKSAEDRAAAIERSAHAQNVLVDALSILPESQLQASVRRGFYSWPEEQETSSQEFISGVMQKVADEARALVGAELAAVGIGDDPRRPFFLWAFSGFPEKARAAIGRIPHPIGTLGLVARRGEVIRTADVMQHPSFQGLPPGHPKLTSFLGVPITYRGRALGNLYLANRIGASEFSSDDQHAIETLAAQTGLALQQAFLQASVEAQRAQCQSLIDSVPNGLMFVNDDNRHVVANPSAMALFGMTISADTGAEQYLDILRYPDGRVVPFDRLPSVRALRGEEHPTEEFVVVRNDGSQIPILSTAAPVRGFGQKLLGAVVNFEDLSPLRDLEHLQNLEHARQEFNASLAHDLRNPIQTVLAQIYALLKKADGAEVRVSVEALCRIERSATALGRLAALLLDVARVELKRIDLRRAVNFLSDVVEEIIARIRPRIEHDGHPLKLEIDDRPLVWLDAGAFEQILTNLVDNAAKYSPSKTPITVSVKNGDGGTFVSVEDRGAGIPENEQARVFDRLYRTDTVRTRKAGLGLGLFIVKGYAEAHGGRVSVESELGKGSVFRVWLPLFAGSVGKPSTRP